jgi:uncharacterized SAM-binding protein YcdF (DUF218 family)
MFSELKPYINVIVFSPTLLLLGIAFGSYLSGKRTHAGRLTTLFLVSVLWLLANPIFSDWLTHSAIKQYSPVSAATLRSQNIQAIVVLGGGVDTGQPNGIQQLKPTALDRLRHGIELSRKSGIPILVSGGKGWGAIAESLDEASISKRVALEAFQYEVKWTESESRDTRENALNCKEKLTNLGIKKIALVTHAWHMPRSVKAFEKVGFEVTPAPMGFTGKKSFELVSLLPSSNSLNNTFSMLKELAALLIQDQ